ncbi:hypothetical protein GCM10010271_30750 [Streptomyces kurssanovii]|nr:hypothetical protein GCM10010271_30750 [Streptomyces kurssanovii]
MISRTGVSAWRGCVIRLLAVDILVHGQDIALAPGRERTMPVSAAADAADRVWTLRFPPRPWPLPKARLVAARGAGEEVRAPVSALLMLLTGRAGRLLPPPHPGAGGREALGLP